MPSELNGTSTLCFRGQMHFIQQVFWFWFWGQEHCNFCKSALSSGTECKIPSEVKYCPQIWMKTNNMKHFLFLLFSLKTIWYLLLPSLQSTSGHLWPFTKSRSWYWNSYFFCHKHLHFPYLQYTFKEYEAYKFQIFVCVEFCRQT